MTDRRVQRLSLVVAFGLVALMGAQCQPPKPPPPLAAPGEHIAYYVTFEAETEEGFRSPAPHARPVGAAGTSAQAVYPDGSVALGVTGLASGDGTIGSSFETRPFRFGDLLTVRIDLTAGSDELIVLLRFDTDGDGDFFEWDAAGGLIGSGDDLSAQCLDDVLTTGSVDEATECVLFGAGGPIGTFTVGELQAGAHPGLDANTVANIAVALVTDSRQSADAQALVSSILLNGFDLLVP